MVTLEVIIIITVDSLETIVIKRIIIPVFSGAIIIRVIQVEVYLAATITLQTQAVGSSGIPIIQQTPIMAVCSEVVQPLILIPVVAEVYLEAVPTQGSAVILEARQAGASLGAPIPLLATVVVCLGIISKLILIQVLVYLEAIRPLPITEEDYLEIMLILQLLGVACLVVINF